MHDIDRTQLEASMEYQEYEFAGELQEVFNEGELMELAGELLEVRDEQELNYFLGDLVRKAGGAIGSAIRSPLGQQLGGILKSAARNAALQAVPVVSDAIGTRVGGRLGPAIAKGLTAFGTTALGEEYEGVNQEDREFEGAKQFVQLAANTVKNAVTAPSSDNPQQAARSALVTAARAIAPGLLSGGAAASAAPRLGHVRHSGVWYRRGNKIILQGA
ncbi:hypothetical protein [Bradyrhizobium sp. Ai1a-2]|uniref:hypothetical protein n=1 Tax=Bradyrhizobium sp. Ai1a-2 TaxID=196490 RepID=UPI000420D39F|nr:hypothetical protein [Bradyrhizobium sp. Ai1a-2]